MTIWVGERDSKLAVNQREVIEADGFRVRVFRTLGRACTTLSKQPHLQHKAVAVAAAADAPALLSFLAASGADVPRLVVDIEGLAQEEVKALVNNLALRSGAAAQVEVDGGANGQNATGTSWWSLAQDWPEIWSAVRRATGSTSPRPPAGALASAAPPEQPAGGAQAKPAQGGSASHAAKPWTLLWVSSLAYKPEGTIWRERLESLGCRVKGYKTFAKAARALDKKTALPCTVVLVSAAEAEALLAYLAARREMDTGLEVVISAPTAKAAPPLAARARPPGAPPCRLVIGGLEPAATAVHAAASTANRLPAGAVGGA